MSKMRSLLWGLPLLGLGFPASAQLATAELVADLTTGPTDWWSRTAGDLRTLDGVAVFTSYDRIHGIELWATRGGEETRLLGDICPGSCLSMPRGFVTDGRELFFLANDGFDFSILYSTDGERLRRYGRHDGSGVVLGGNLYFLRHENPGTSEERRVLWRATRETALIEPFLVLCEGDCDSPTADSPTAVGAAGDQLFLTGPASFSVLRPGVDSAPRHIADVSGSRFFALPNGRIVFLGPANVGSPGPHEYLWTTDGTAAGTRPLGEPTPVPFTLVAFGDKVYFTTIGKGIYATDGIQLGPSGDLAMPAGLPYQLLGTTSQAIYYLSGDRLFSFVPGVGRRQLFQGKGSFLGALPDGRAILTEEAKPGDPTPIFVSDGSPAGTSLLRTVRRVTGDYRATTGSGLLFQVYESGVHSQLWHSDGTAAGTGPLDFELQESSRPDLYATSGLLYVGTESQQVFALRPGTSELTPVAGKYRPLGVLPTALIAVDQQNGMTMALSAQDTESPENLGVLGGDNVSPPAKERLYFANNDLGQKLWESNGSAAGTRELTDPWPSYQLDCGPIPEYPCYGRDYPRDITPSGNKVFFEAFLPGAEQVIYAYDLLSDTRQEKISFDESVSFRLEMESLGDGRVAIFRFWSVRPDTFPYISTENHLELWISDGSVSGTRRLAEVVHSEEWNFTSPFLVRSGNQLYFPVPFGDRHELWTSDLATGVTQKFAVWPRLDLDREDWLVLDGRLIFPAATAEAGFELWQSDGTLAGTQQIQDLAPGAPSSMPSRPFSLGDGRFVFAAGDAQHDQDRKSVV